MTLTFAEQLSDELDEDSVRLIAAGEASIIMALATAFRYRCSIPELLDDALFTDHRPSDPNEAMGAGAEAVLTRVEGDLAGVVVAHLERGL